MTPNEAILELEDSFDKELSAKQTAKFQKFLSKFDGEQVEAMTMKAIEDCKYMPKIAHLNDARKDLMIQQPDRARKPDKDCRICAGTGWQYITVLDKFFNQETQAVKPCGCKDDPGPAPGPGGVF